MTVAKALKTTSKVVFAPLLLTFLRISKSKPAIRPKRKRGKMLMSGFMKSMSKALVAAVKARIQLKTPKARPYKAPLFQPERLAPRMTGRWRRVKVMTPPKTER